MALRLRRGTDAERLLIAPLEGELIYTTDTKILYIGDGSTQGGVQVTGAFPESINDLNDVDISSLSPEPGQVLKWNGVEFVPSDLIGIGEQINVDIIADDSTVLVDSQLQNFQGNTFAGQDFIGDTFTGAFIGDGSQLTNLPVSTDGSGIIEGSNYRINIAADDSTIMVNTDTQTFTGNFVGDGSQLTNLNLSNNSIFDLSDVFTFTPPDIDDLLMYDGFNFRPQKIRQIEGTDSTVIVDTSTNTFTGNFVGDLFSQDTSLLVDSTNNEFNGDIISTGLSSFSNIDMSGAFPLFKLISESNTGGFGAPIISIYNNHTGNSAQEIVFNRSNGTFDTPTSISSGDYIGSLTYRAHDSNDYTTVGAMHVIADAVNGVDDINTSIKLVTRNGSITEDYGTALELRPDKGAVVTGYVQFGNYTSIERANITPAAGMVIWNSDTNQFEGFDGTNWINLIDGTISS